MQFTLLKQQMMNQKQIEALNQEEYCHLLSYGDPILTDLDESSYDTAHDDFEIDSQLTKWISTLESTTYPGWTFGYHETVQFVPLYTST